jgi:hypothetical protein
VRNVTIALDDETARWARIEAAKRDTSVSRMVGEMLRELMTEADEYERAQRSFLDRAAMKLSEPQSPYPSREEIHAR